MVTRSASGSTTAKRLPSSRAIVPVWRGPWRGRSVTAITVPAVSMSPSTPSTVTTTE